MEKIRENKGVLSEAGKWGCNNIRIQRFYRNTFRDSEKPFVEIENKRMEGDYNPDRKIRVFLGPGGSGKREVRRI